MNHRRILFACLLTSILSACAASGDGEVEQELMSRGGDAEATARSVLSESMRLHTAVSSAFGRVKAEVDENEFLLFEEIQRALQEGTLRNERVFESAAEEILELMLNADEDLLAAEVNALLWRFAELTSVERPNIPLKRLGGFLDDATKLRSRVWVFATSDRVDQHKRAYYFASAYNVVMSTLVVGLAAGGYKRSTIELGFRDAIETNQHLLGTGEANGPGYLPDWVAAQTPGSASAQVKIDSDPVIFSVRRALEEQQQALE